MASASLHSPPSVPKSTIFSPAVPPTGSYVKVPCPSWSSCGHPGGATITTPLVVTLTLPLPQRSPHPQVAVREPFETHFFRPERDTFGMFDARATEDHRRPTGGW